MILSSDSVAVSLVPWLSFAKMDDGPGRSARFLSLVHHPAMAWQFRARIISPLDQIKPAAHGLEECSCYSRVHSRYGWLCDWSGKSIGNATCSGSKFGPVASIVGWGHCDPMKVEAHNTVVRNSDPVWTDDGGNKFVWIVHLRVGVIGPLF